MTASHGYSGRKWTWFNFVALAFVCSLFSLAQAQYFVVNQPSASSSWAIGSPYPLSWSKGLLDGVNSFDIELTRLRGDGILRIAKDVPSTYKSLNVLLQDVPEGDDYFVVCLNSTHGIVYTVSSRFSITNSSSSQNPSPDRSAPTVTVSGLPDPLKQFASTLGASSNGGSSLILARRFSPNTGALSFGAILALCAAFLGGAMALW